MFPRIILKYIFSHKQWNIYFRTKNGDENDTNNMQKLVCYLFRNACNLGGNPVNKISIQQKDKQVRIGVLIDLFMVEEKWYHSQRWQRTTRIISSFRKRWIFFFVLWDSSHSEELCFLLTLAPKALELNSITSMERMLHFKPLQGYSIFTNIVSLRTIFPSNLC